MERLMQNRLAVLHALCDEENAQNKSEAAIQCCRMFLGMNPAPEGYRRHIDFQPED
jgi:hypothetical protein